jgi:hypothetical protein
MKIANIIPFIDSGHMALPEFQRGYVWNRDQVRGLIWSLYKRYPVGSLLVWAERRRLLAEATNEFLDSLHQVVESRESLRLPVEHVTPTTIPGGIESKDEEAMILGIQAWMIQKSLPDGDIEYELLDEESGDVIAILDLAWPSGVQTDSSDPVALLIDEPPEVVKAAVKQGFHVFEAADDFKTYVANKILGDHLYGRPDWATLLDTDAILIARHIVDKGLPSPQCGYEVLDAQNEVKGEFELAWPERKVGIWTRRGREQTDKVMLDGWITFHQDEVIASPGLLSNSLNRPQQGR